VASRSALKIIQKGVKRFSPQFKEDRTGFLQKLIKAGNEVVYQLACEKNQQSASTLAIMFIEDDYAVLGHVGDSRIYLVREGNILQLTRDHSKWQELLDRNPHLALTRNQYSDGHVITRALGVEKTVQPDIQKVLLKQDDVFLLCTDGIYSYNSDEEMRQAVNRNKDQLAAVCESLKSKCYQGGAKDNLTVIVVKIAKEETEVQTKSYRIR